MNIIVTANAVPFIHGGADYHIEGLIKELRIRGHKVESIRFPFQFNPNSEVTNLMVFCESQNYNCPNGQVVDRVISLQFPAYGVHHHSHVIWLMHQHREAYDLYPNDPKSQQTVLRDQIVDYDNRTISAAAKVFANSICVSERLQKFNQIKSAPLYHPPYAWKHFYNQEAQDFIFFPSRLEQLKRQDLLIKAAQYLESPVKIILGGSGGQRGAYQVMIDKFDLGDRVRLIGRFSEQEKFTYYAQCLAVFFAPKDEDYGYITLEAMLSSKPVITCKDSGGPLEFVEDQITGYVCDPDPRTIARAIDKLYADKQKAKSMGQAGYNKYHAANISWDNVIENLLGPL
jgi:glycosyltransferase involved in cell wall biosynthesis